MECALDLQFQRIDMRSLESPYIITSFSTLDYSTLLKFGADFPSRAPWTMFYSRANPPTTTCDQLGLIHILINYSRDIPARLPRSCFLVSFCLRSCCYFSRFPLLFPFKSHTNCKCPWSCQSRLYMPWPWSGGSSRGVPRHSRGCRVIFLSVHRLVAIHMKTQFQTSELGNTHAWYFKDLLVGPQIPFLPNAVNSDV